MKEKSVLALCCAPAMVMSMSKKSHVYPSGRANDQGVFVQTASYGSGYPQAGGTGQPGMYPTHNGYPSQGMGYSAQGPGYSVQSYANPAQWTGYPAQGTGYPSPSNPTGYPQGGGAYPTGAPPASAIQSGQSSQAFSASTPPPPATTPPKSESTTACENCGLLVVERLKDRHKTACAAREPSAVITQPVPAVDAAGTVIATPADAMGEDKECCICLDEQKSHAFVPCGHMAVCGQCARGLTQCPMCRRAIESTIRVFM